MSTAKTWWLIGLYIVLVLTSTTVAIWSGNTILAVTSQAFPGIIALVLTLVLRGRRARFQGFGVSRLGQPKWYLLSLFPIVPIAASYLGAWGMGWVDLPPQDALRGISQWDRLWLIARSYLAWWLPLPFLWALGEELGWRGFLQTELSAVVAARRAAIAIGCVWAVWHYGYIFGGDYYSEGNPWLNAGLFSVTVIFMSVVMAWLRLQCGSIWPAVLFHGVSNIAWQYWNIVFPIKHAGWVYVAGEAGAFNAVIWALAAWYSWRRLDGTVSVCPARGSQIQPVGGRS